MITNKILYINNCIYIWYGSLKYRGNKVYYKKIKESKNQLLANSNCYLGNCILLLWKEKIMSNIL